MVVRGSVVRGRDDGGERRLMVVRGGGGGERGVGENSELQLTCDEFSHMTHIGIWTLRIFKNDLTLSHLM